MRHNRNAIARLIFIVTFYFASFELFKRLVKAPNAGFYILFIIISTSYYLLGILDFNKKFSSKNLIYIGVINVVCGGINYFFTKDYREIMVYLILIIIVTLIKLIIGSLTIHQSNVMLVGEESALTTKIKVSLVSSNEYNYLGKCTNEEIGRLEQIVIEKNINYLIITEEKIIEKYTKEILNLKLKGVKVQLDWQYNEAIEGKIDASKINEKWLLHSGGFNILHDDLQRRIKRFFDICLVFIIGIFAIPIIFINAITMKVIGLFNKKERGPLFFKQKRIGQGGKAFEIIKFRSMLVKENWDLVGFDPNAGDVWTEADDPRITKLGKILRKTRVDELPQLINVFKGEMSFVGPRPESVSYVKMLEQELSFYNVRHAVVPGLTGWAQVMYPYGASVEDSLRKLEFDLYYIKYQNFVMDISIFFKTVKTVLFGRGR